MTAKKQQITKPTNFEMVTEFNKVLGQGVAPSPRIANYGQCVLRLSVIKEEAEVELTKAINDRDLVAIADAIGDGLVTLYGAANDMGLDADAIMQIVHKANMSKLCNSEDEAKAAVERYKAGDGLHGKTEPIEAAYRESSIEGKFIVYDANTGKTLKGLGFTPPEAELEKLIYPQGRPTDRYAEARAQAIQSSKEGRMSPVDLWCFQGTLDDLNAEANK